MNVKELSAKEIARLDKLAENQYLLNDPDKPKGAREMKLGSAIQTLQNNKKVVLDAVYDFDSQGGAQGQILLGLTLPTGAIVTAMYTRTLDVLASGGAATVAIKAGASTLKAATAFNDASYVGLQEQSLSGPVLIASESRLEVEVAVADLTAGKIRIMVEYLKA